MCAKMVGLQNWLIQLYIHTNISVGFFEDNFSRFLYFGRKNKDNKRLPSFQESQSDEVKIWEK